MADHGNDQKINFPKFLRCNARRLVGSAFAYAAIAFPALPTAAQDPERDETQKQVESKVLDAENGLVLSRKLCSTCHLIGEPINAASPADVPSFQSIANRPIQSAEALTNWLIVPHTPMPDPSLTRKEIRDLAGYILSLRKAD